MTPENAALEADLLARDHAAFWLGFRELLSSTDEPSADTCRALLTQERCISPERVRAMTDGEIAWMLRKLRKAAKIRIYRAAPLKHVAGFVWRTNLDHAMHEAFDQYGGDEQMLAIGEIDPRRLLFRFETGGRKQVIALPESVRTIKIQRVNFIPG